ncbi:TPA: hypothetical protein MYP48_003011 [Citrobacter freundii]|uniref:hypothetical protein n=1 Tax=Citrobacter freundii TaxID=546 RepID=UPI001BCE587C|nr:hypothetical protein [Citrobacter freundii]HCB1601143.1 hypothetical protein [Citrobacter freundii]HCB1725709.1 hypothetical protein [Citrobacter freundii]HCB1877265.1 hypothetical protein [Citrobacter freundii]
MTTNHPTHGPVSLDRLHQIREILSKAAAQSDGGNLGYAMADAVKVIDGAIAVFGAEPVAYADPQAFDNFKSNGGKNAACTKEWMWRDPSDGLIPLYTAPPAPVVDADDNFYSWFGRQWEQYYQPNNYSLSAKKHLGAIAESAWFACRAAMLQAGNSPVTPDGYVLVPNRLTAENGAKGVLSGEFSETKFINCPECFGEDECETCDGSGRLEITVPVTWTTIKAIWAKGIEHFEAATQQEVKNG